MKKWVVIIISVVLMLALLVAAFAFRAFGSSSSASINTCDPYNVNIEKGDKSNSVDISWETKGDCAGYVLYGENIKDLDLVGVDSINSVKSRKHIVVLSGLLSTKSYYFSIVSGDINFGKNGLPIFFTLDSL